MMVYAFMTDGMFDCFVVFLCDVNENVMTAVLSKKGQAARVAC